MSYTHHMDGKRRYRRLVVAGFALGYASALAALLGLKRSLPPSDGAYDQTFLLLIVDPIVQMLVIPTVVLSVGLITPFVKALLWKTPLRLTVPIVGGAGIVVAFLCGPMGLLAALPVILSVLGVALACRCVQSSSALKRG